jgi:hypothetical protein
VASLPGSGVAVDSGGGSTRCTHSATVHFLSLLILIFYRYHYYCIPFHSAVGVITETEAAEISDDDLMVVDDGLCYISYTI